MSKPNSLVVVTVVKDDLQALQKTSLSVLKQSIRPTWLIVTPKDGSPTWNYASQLSNDGSSSSLLIDNGGGVYTAMNLAIQELSNDQWIWFLNAGDEFADKDSVKNVLNYLSQTPHNWVYGGHFLGSAEGKILGEIKAPEKFKSSNQLFARKYVSHQAVIFKNSFLKSLNGFRPNLKVAADWDLLVRAASIDTGERIPTTLAVFYMGGLSTESRQQGNWELLKLRSEHLGKRYWLKSIFWFGYRSLRNMFVQSFEGTNPYTANLIRKIRLRIKARFR